MDLSIANFGTLFRLREMIYLGLVLIPRGSRWWREVNERLLRDATLFDGLSV